MGPVKLDLRKARADHYTAPRDEFRELVVPPLRYLAVDGAGDPDGPEYAAAVGALYAAGFTLKLAVRERTGLDVVVGPLEGLWSSPDPAAFTRGRRDDWEWTMLLPLADEVTEADVTGAVGKAAERKPELPVASVRLLELDEGRSLQILHVGPYADEAPTLARLHDEVMPGRGFTWNGRHHEIYLGDPRRTAPERLRTILRQPVRPAG